MDGLILEQTSMGQYWNKTAPQRTTLEWKKHRGAYQGFRKHLDNYDWLLRGCLFCMGGGWKRARMIRLISLWFMTSHSKPHRLFFFFFLLTSSLFLSSLRQGSSFILLHVDIQPPNRFYWKRLSFPHCVLGALMKSSLLVPVVVQRAKNPT